MPGYLQDSPVSQTLDSEGKHCGLCQGLGMLDQCFILLRIFEDAWEFAQPVYMCFVGVFYGRCFGCMGCLAWCYEPFGPYRTTARASFTLQIMLCTGGFELGFRTGQWSTFGSGKPGPDGSAVTSCLYSWCWGCTGHTACGARAWRTPIIWARIRTQGCQAAPTSTWIWAWISESCISRIQPPKISTCWPQATRTCVRVTRVRGPLTPAKIVTCSAFINDLSLSWKTSLG